VVIYCSFTPPFSDPMRPPDAPNPCQAALRID
jgi:hypothetical protein